MIFKGIGTALITPFNEDYSVDYKSLKEIVSFQIKNGVDAIILLGTTGESPVISTEERKKIIDTGVQAAEGNGVLVEAEAAHAEGFGAHNVAARSGVLQGEAHVVEVLGDDTGVYIKGDANGAR